MLLFQGLALSLLVGPVLSQIDKDQRAADIAERQVTPCMSLEWYAAITTIQSRVKELSASFYNINANGVVAQQQYFGVNQAFGLVDSYVEFAATRFSGCGPSLPAAGAALVTPALSTMRRLWSSMATEAVLKRPAFVAAGYDDEIFDRAYYQRSHLSRFSTSLTNKVPPAQLGAYTTPVTQAISTDNKSIIVNYA